MNELALCSGVGMLSEGVRAACEFLGLEHRVVCHVEREIPAAAQLVALMEAGIIDPAPIWSDLLTFKGKQWRKRVDCITGGFPCQPWSAAGKQEGIEDERWIWPDIARIVCEIEPALCFFENVRGLVSGGGLEFVLADLARLGFHAQWCVVSAADVGASQERERVFILAYRKGQRFRKARGDCRRSAQRSGIGSIPLGDTKGKRTGTRSVSFRIEPQNARATSASGNAVFAPGPISDRWPGIIADHPHLRPATEPGVRMLVDGVAYVVDESRSDQLRAVGNGVVPLAAAVAFVVLARRAGIV